MKARWPLLASFLRRDLQNRFSGSFSGGAWALVQPVLQLAVFSFVFQYIFRARIPGADAPDFIPFLMVALWPWTAFSEAVVRATTSIQENAALIGKVALPRAVLVFASVGTSFLIHIGGFLAIALVLALMGRGVSMAGLALSLLLFLPLLALAMGFSLLFASLQVFVRDLAQALTQLMTLLMFTAPVFYPRTALPEAARPWMDLNLFTFYAESFRSLVLGYGSVSPLRVLGAVLVALAVLALGAWVFRRLDPHFEDFL